MYSKGHAELGYSVKSDLCLFLIISQLLTELYVMFALATLDWKTMWKPRRLQYKDPYVSAGYVSLSESPEAELESTYNTDSFLEESNYCFDLVKYSFPFLHITNFQVYFSSLTLLIFSSLYSQLFFYQSERKYFFPVFFGSFVGTGGGKDTTAHFFS